MTGFFVVEPVAVDEQGRRVPDDLPVETPARDKLENALRASGYAIISVDADAAAPASRTGTTQLRAAVKALVNEADDSELDRLEAAATAESPDDLDERFWGPGPDSVTAAKAVFADLSDQFAQRQQLAANGISRDDAAKLLGITAQSVTAKLASRKLVGIKSGREWRLPTWQFDPDVPTCVLPDLDALQAVFPGGPVSLSSWMLRSQPEFEGRTAREEMILHGSAPVIELARVLTATGW
ncbi:helix-turn-helix domain-containing protein [Candidatus Mycobacterium methanotrophicum]|uniref:Helix-turn-helix domain-containing protein n=1 Tax=Candidatus Mycobacterium methanotrophicum TaxID=2943498 RepID=A0ABY4QKC1_9MYCO|nr:helix-turn-helix domain-containing protein [Candidatus Mycobacterium methanotrophicum]UQX11480.1 helix-turn-helix domain-containing protein [Candidatus Mycobacterium methanotrophicum]